MPDTTPHLFTQPRAPVLRNHGGHCDSREPPGGRDQNFAVELVEQPNRKPRGLSRAGAADDEYCGVALLQRFEQPRAGEVCRQLWRWGRAQRVPA